MKLFCNLNKLYISCKFFGRLGNNMFQIASTISLADKINYTPIFVPWQYEFLFSGKNKYYDHTNPTKLPPMKVINHEMSFYIPIETGNKINIIINGLFQSEKYFNENIVRNHFKFSDIINKYMNLKYYNILKKCENKISIHVRRTDLLNNPWNKILKLQTMDYYEEAMSIFNNEKFVIFSDDIEWCKNNFSNKLCEFIHNKHDYIDFYISSKCKGNIISNSTFSWWAAWISKNEKIVGPSRWYQKNKNYNLIDKDIIPSKWIKI